MDDIIKAIESKGYIVRKIDNMFQGKLDEKYPKVYEILNPDYSEVYGANSIIPECLPDWLSLPDLNKKVIKEVPHRSSEDEKARKAKEVEYDNLYNEGAEGYNPYRA
jgi:hypothetical protein